MRSEHFYGIDADPAASQRWFLQSPKDENGNEIDPRIFTHGVAVPDQPLLTLPIRQNGNEVSFNFADFDMVVTPAELNEKLQDLLGSTIQRFPVSIAESKRRFEILNICSLVKCVDEKRSTFTKWEESDHRPDKIGSFRMFIKLHIDIKAARGHDMFRIAEWPIALVVSERMRKFLESNAVDGISYTPLD